MNKKILIGIVVVVVIGVAGYRYSVLKKMTSDSTIPNVAFTEGQIYCFGRLQKATADAPYRVEEHMRLVQVAGKITGTKQGTQAGPDMTNGFTGTMRGEMKDDYLEFIYAYTIDGAAQKEFEVYTIDGANLIKQRYALSEATKDGDKVLIPNLTTTPLQQPYLSESCSN